MEAAATKFRTRDIAYIAVFVALMAICSWISIPTAIPFTLQTMAIFLAAGLLGGRRGTLAVLAYILLFNGVDRLPGDAALFRQLLLGQAQLLPVGIVHHSFSGSSIATFAGQYP